MIAFLQILSLVFEILTWLVIIKVILSYFLPPYHQVRETLDRVLEPLLAPIRELVPPTGGVDFSPLVLILIIRVVGFLITKLFLTMF